MHSGTFLWTINESYRCQIFWAQQLTYTIQDYMLFSQTLLNGWITWTHYCCGTQIFQKPRCQKSDICGWFEKSVRSQRVGTTGAYRCYFQLVAYLGGIHTKCQPNRSITLCSAFVWIEKAVWFPKNGRKNFVCWSNITLWKANRLRRLKRSLINIMANLHLRLAWFISGFKIFGVATWARVMLNFLKALLRPLLQKSLIKSRKWWWMIEEWNC